MNSMPPSANYQPSPCTVVIGKGRLPMQAEGNHNLRTIVKSFLEAYSAANHKSVKSNLVSNFYATIVNSCTPGEEFVKYDGEGFHPVTEHQAREKVAGTFRDCLSHKYKSSCKNKVAKRREARKNQRKQRRSHQSAQQHQQQRKHDVTAAWMVPTSLERVVTPELTVFNMHSNDIEDALPLPALGRVRTFSIPSMEALLDAPSRQSLVSLMNGFASFAAPIDFDFSEVIEPFMHSSNSTTISASDDEDLLSLSAAESSCMLDHNYHGDFNFQVAV